MFYVWRKSSKQYAKEGCLTVSVEMVRGNWWIIFLQQQKEISILQNNEKKQNTETAA